MSNDGISIISVRGKNDIEDTNFAEENIRIKTSQGRKEALRLIGFPMTIIITSIVFVIPFSTIPRSNSIIYQTAWTEYLLPVSIALILMAAYEVLKLAVWTQEPNLIDVKVFLKVYFAWLITHHGLYIVCYEVWCVHLMLKHPMPFVGAITIITSWLLTCISLCLILPSVLLQRLDFRHKLKMYMVYFVWSIFTIVQNEVLSSFFKKGILELPSGFQFLVPFLVAGCREVDKKVKSKIVSKMVGQYDARAFALVDINVSAHYALFISVRLVNAEWSTILCSVALDFFLHSYQTYQIVKQHKKVAVEGTEVRNTNNELIAKVLLPEIIEGLTPIIYGICIALAFYGPNSHILSNIGNEYWGEKIEKIEVVFVTMFVLFAVDTISVMTTFLWLWKMTKINVVQEISNLLANYWLFLAMSIAHRLLTYFATTDINTGMDGSGSFFWTSHEGWLSIIKNSEDLTDDEKILILTNATVA